MFWRYLASRLWWLLVSFVALVFLLASLQWLIESAKKFRVEDQKLSAFEQGTPTDLKQWARKMQRESEDRAKELQRSGDARIEQRKKEVDGAIHQLDAGPRLGTGALDLSDLLLRGTLEQAVKAEIELKLLNQERSFLESLQSFNSAALGIRRAREELDRRLQIHTTTWRAVEQNEKAQRQLQATSPVTYLIPFTPAHQQMEGLKERHDRLWRDNETAHRQYLEQQQLCESMSLRPLPDLSLAKPMVDDVFTRLEQGSRDLRKTLDEAFFYKLVSRLGPFAWPAISILVGAMLAPLGIRAFLYFVAAPLAERRPPIRFPHGATESGSASGATVIRSFRQGFGQLIDVDPQHELLIRSDFLQSSAATGRAQTQWLLNARYPLASLASGMYGLTRIRGQSTESVSVSSSSDALSEIATFDLPNGEAVILQPHHLVGVLQRRDMPMKVSSHWRLGTLHAWLTFQFRYLMFHGPATILVKGCRGVRVQEPDRGRSVNQAATIGFSSGLSYRTSRTETFVAYLSGQKTLLNDRFDGVGYCLYQEMPQAAGRAGVTGRGLEGILDGCLKAFGI